MNQQNVYNNRKTYQARLKKPAFKRSRAYGKLPSAGVVAVSRPLMYKPEIKHATYSVLADTINFVNPISNVAGLIHQAYPPISQGTNNSQRIGNKISIVSSKIKCSLFTEQNSVAQPPISMRVMVGRKKQIPASSPSPYFFDIWDGGSLSLPFQGNRLDNILPVNKDSWHIVYDKRFKIGPNDFSGLNQQNNDFKILEDFEIDLTPFMKTLQYTDGTTDPVTGGMWIWFIPNFSSEQTTVSGTTSHVKVTLVDMLQYTDM